MKTTRRALLGAVAAAPALVAMPAATAEIAAPGIRPMFQRKIDRFRRLQAAWDKFDDEVETAARRRFAARADALPHTTAYMGVNHSGKDIIFSTENDWQVATVNRLLQEPLSDETFMAGARIIAEGQREREAAKATFREEEGITALAARGDRFGNVAASAEWAVITTRVANAAELRLKLAFAHERDMSGEDLIEEIAADAFVLAGEVA